MMSGKEEKHFNFLLSFKFYLIAISKAKPSSSETFRFTLNDVVNFCQIFCRWERERKVTTKLEGNRCWPVIDFFLLKGSPRLPTSLAPSLPLTICSRPSRDVLRYNVSPLLTSLVWCSCKSGGAPYVFQCFSAVFVLCTSNRSICKATMIDDLIAKHKKKISIKDFTQLTPISKTTTSKPKI